MSFDTSTLPLGEIVSVKGGKRLPKGASLQSTPNSHPYIRVRDMGYRYIPSEGLEFVPDEIFPKIRRYIVEENDVIISIVGTIGLVSIIDRRFHLASQTENAAKLTGLDFFDAHYLYYYLTSHAGQQEIRKGTVGAVQPKLPLYNIEKIQVPWLERNTRVQIVNYLASLDDKARLNHQINQTLESISQALFKSWFVDFDPVKAKIDVLEAGGSEEEALIAAMQVISSKNAEELAAFEVEKPEEYAELRATAELFPSAMVDSELGEIPEGWGVRQIGDVLDRLRPSKRYTKKQVEPIGDVPVFEQGTGLLLGFHNDIAGFNATPENPIFIFGDHTCITHISCQSFDISQNVIPLKGKGRPTVWTYYAIQGKQLFQEYRRHWAELIVKPIIYPSSELCEVFSKSIAINLRLKESLMKESLELSELRDLLLPKLLSGELDVSELVDSLEAEA